MIISASKKSSVSYMKIVNSLTVYFAEKISHPEFIDLSGGLKSKRKNQYITENTNIESIFDLILNYAIENQLPQSELPYNIFNLLNCEYDSITSLRNYRSQDNSLFIDIMNNFFLKKKNNSHLYISNAVQNK
ncbi:hypothetical protein BCR32DRAFT_286579 [Anaeromyces robustus]|uniref:Uncharacterized protein n=1 Tax=Anaeromyces robustus TaxID=1754192 RepID=A0A1Y1VWD0_9FUNG|nr:hypothetical protein BCR32DRAFT_286579 [Anaeromyces robustus]|eukprot:ORX65325.1 hypothetical protein BCR32DRAFT_286579 [Anaeromyces robustus]